MYRGFFPKAPELGEPQSEYDGRDVLHDAADGMERLSMLMLIPSSAATIVFPLFYSFAEAAIVLAFSVPILASCLAVIVGARRLEKMALAPMLVTVGTVVPLALLTVLAVLYLVGGGLAADPILGAFLAAPLVLYAFGLVRLRRKDVRAYFWERREQAIEQDRSLMGDAQNSEDEEVVFAHDDVDDVDEESRAVATSTSAR